MKITINEKSVTIRSLNYPAASILYGFQEDLSGNLTGKVELVHNSTMKNITDGFVPFSDIINEATGEQFEDVTALKTFFTENFKSAGSSEFDGTVSADQVEGLLNDQGKLNPDLIDPEGLEVTAVITYNNDYL